MTTDFFDSAFQVRKRFWQRRRVARIFDILFDGRIALEMRHVKRNAERLPLRDVLVAAVVVPQRVADLQRVLGDFGRTRHRVEVCRAPMGRRGKFDNINIALKDHELDRFDWLVVTDDDVQLPPNFLDSFLYIAEAMNLKIAQPAHRCLSYTSTTFNYRRWNVLGRATRFVECGPVTAFHRDIVPYVVPFPPLRWAWGTDLAWGTVAAQHGMAIGVVDCTPIEHLKGVALDYDAAPAVDEARAFLASSGVLQTREELLVDTRVLRTVRGGAIENVNARSPDDYPARGVIQSSNTTLARPNF